MSAYAPRGVFCMMSAARYYGLTTFLPDAVDVTIGRTMKISTLPDWPDADVVKDGKTFGGKWSHDMGRWI